METEVREQRAEGQRSAVRGPGDRGQGSKDQGSWDRGQRKKGLRQGRGQRALRKTEVRGRGSEDIGPEVRQKSDYRKPEARSGQGQASKD